MKKDKKNKKGIQDYIQKTKKPRNFFWTVFLILFSIYLVSYFYAEYQKDQDAIKPSLTELVQSINEGEVESIIVSGVNVDVTYKDESKGILRKDNFTSFEDTLINLGVSDSQFASIEYRINKETGPSVWVRNILPFLFPILILLVFFWFISKQAKGMGMQAFQFGKSRAQLIDPKDKKNRVLFKDVAGLIEAKEELGEFVDFLKAPDKFFAIGSKVPKGVILTGAPGTGKTLLARAVAGEAGVPFFSISGSEFVEMFVGVGASRVRDLFQNAKKYAPSIIFIDEIDSVGRVRGGGMGGGNDEREQALNQILVEMDGFEKDEKVIVMAASNRADVLDPALLRPGRFDRKVMIGVPDIKERIEILKIHAKNKKIAKDADFEVVARRTPGLSGADLASIINEAGILAVRKSKTEITQEDLLQSIEKVLFGPENKSRVITEREKEIIAYHEAGHAVLASLLPYANPVQKITIVSRGHAGGYVLTIPDKERRLKSRKEFIDDITMSLGGYVAEEMVFGDITTGPSSDLNSITAIANEMVTRFGMSALGPKVLRKDRFNGIVNSKDKHAEKTEEEIDKEVDKIIKSSLSKAKTLLKKNRKILDKLVKKLLEVETLEREEYEDFLKKEGVKIQNKLD